MMYIYIYTQIEGNTYVFQISSLKDVQNTSGLKLGVFTLSKPASGAAPWHMFAYRWGFDRAFASITTRWWPQVFRHQMSPNKFFESSWVFQQQTRKWS